MGFQSNDKEQQCLKILQARSTMFFELANNEISSWMIKSELEIPLFIGIGEKRWLPDRDSNPNRRYQKPASYR